MREALERQFRVASPLADVWARLLEVPRVASWLPILNSVTERVALTEYGAVLEDKVGGFALRADLQIDVVRLEDMVEIAVHAYGEDRQVRSRILIDAAARLDADGVDGTLVSVSGSYEITGRVATLGAGVIRSKANKLVDRFCAEAEGGLA
jgi:carbon monoxide dehydrogenase subunit G